MFKVYHYSMGVNFRGAVNVAANGQRFMQVGDVVRSSPAY